MSDNYVDKFNVIVRELSVNHTLRSKKLYVSVDFDQFKQCKTEVLQSTHDGKAQWPNTFHFQYETKFIDKLNRKLCKLTLYRKKKIGSDSMVGQVQIDLHTLGTGPVQHDVLLTKGTVGVGRTTFKLEMQHITQLRIDIAQIAVTNMDSSLFSSASDSTNFIEYSLNKNNIITTQKVTGSSCPTWNKLAPITQVISLKDLVDSHVHIELKASHALKSSSLAQLKIPINKIFSFIEGDNKVINSVLLDMHNKRMADIHIKLQFNDIPQLAQMKDGIHTETGVLNGQPFFSGVPLPNILGDMSKQQLQQPEQHLQLPPGWEAKVDRMGRTYYIDHNSRTTSWHSPVAVKQPIENRLIQSQLRPLSSSSAEKERRERAAKIIQRTFRKHRKDQYEQSLRRPSYSQQQQGYTRSPLPPGWECRVDGRGRTYYLDHNNRVSTWTPPQLQMAKSR
ncbi:hypothetical protein SAMD00019534_036890 [Acytostelium subglobosum LB1]|uniref:hypothetical protein n=1 Tax=Acytostelium subglobosum LB1 TaxID=1410327 RepID=UPI0006449691|nr:hypothetical protein SAMD00019534_036890 [Acytostelium subglobosum LB1]GAM20514.1 hypothetical protein SAMD00019534_036890 [Acytostelium subglobosum LB1]|eukprot:XP_012760035.1 hypothetical protein SAMD00019534_036890 [Acytostelium subglobosum LB1]